MHQRFRRQKQLFQDCDLEWRLLIKAELIIEHDYAYDESTDSAFTSGIIINNNLTIDGNGYTIDLGGK